MKSMNKHFLVFLFLGISTFLSAEIFNKNLSAADLEKVESGEVLIKNINFQRNMSLNPDINELDNKLFDKIKTLNPHYLAEIIQYKPYEGNEDLPQRLEKILNAIPDYAGIPYWSERAQYWFDLYTSAEIIEQVEEDNITHFKADFLMDPFGLVHEDIDIERADESILYSAINTNKLRYLDQFDCIWPEKMLICIYLFRDGDNWVLYGIGGVNAPRIPFFTQRIQTSFINRINTFCSYIFTQF